MEKIVNALSNTDYAKSFVMALGMCICLVIGMAIFADIKNYCTRQLPEGATFVAYIQADGYIRREPSSVAGKQEAQHYVAVINPYIKLMGIGNGYPDHMIVSLKYCRRTYDHWYSHSIYFGEGRDVDCQDWTPRK